MTDDFPDLHPYLRRTLTSVSFGIIAGMGFALALGALFAGDPLAAGTALCAGICFAFGAFARAEELRKYMRDADIALQAQAMGLDIQTKELIQLRRQNARWLAQAQISGVSGEAGEVNGGTSPANYEGRGQVINFGKPRLVP